MLIHIRAFFSQYDAELRLSCMLGSAGGFLVGTIVGLAFVPLTCGLSLPLGMMGGAFAGALLGGAIGATVLFVKGLIDKRAKPKSRIILGSHRENLRSLLSSDLASGAISRPGIANSNWTIVKRPTMNTQKSAVPQNRRPGF